MLQQRADGDHEGGHEQEERRREQAAVERPATQPALQSGQQAAHRDRVGGHLEAMLHAEPDRGHEGEGAETDHRRQRHEGRRQHETPATAQDDDNGRPQQIELLLDRERPGVSHVPRARRMVVGGVGHGVQEVTGREVEEPEAAHHERGPQERVVRRKDPERAPVVEAQQVDVAGGLDLAQERAGDQEARDHEEDPHADLAELEEARCRVGHGEAARARQVAEQHQHDGDRPQAVEGGDTRALRHGSPWTMGGYKNHAKRGRSAGLAGAAHRHVGTGNFPTLKWATAAQGDQAARWKTTIFSSVISSIA